MKKNKNLQPKIIELDKTTIDKIIKKARKNHDGKFKPYIEAWIKLHADEPVK